MVLSFSNEDKELLNSLHHDEFETWVALGKLYFNEERDSSEKEKKQGGCSLKQVPKKRRIHIWEIREDPSQKKWPDV